VPESNFLHLSTLFTCLSITPCFALAASEMPIELFRQDFENPAAFVNDGGDVNISTTVNENFGGQPEGFFFDQAFTVETLNVTGTEAFGTGFSDPEGQAGNFLIGLLSDFENDLLGLSFDVEGRDFFNFQLDVTSLDLSTFQGPFVDPGDEGRGHGSRPGHSHRHRLGPNGD